MDYPWPGNLREFRNVIRRAALLTTTRQIMSKTLPWEITNSAALSQNALTPEAVHPMPVTINKDSDLRNAASLAEYETIMNVLSR